jgi:uncharacterized protein (DUF2267 family)
MTVMTTAHVDTIERGVEKAHVWLKELADELGVPDQQQSLQVLRAFLHALRDRLSVDETAQLAAQLPLLIRGVYYEGWIPSRAPAHYRDAATFLDHIAREAHLAGRTEASFAAAAAVRVLDRHVSAGETAKVRRVLPPELRTLLAAEA